MVLDNESGLVWAREDSWSIEQDWLTFQEARLSFVDDLNKNRLSGVSRLAHRGERRNRKAFCFRKPNYREIEAGTSSGSRICSRRRQWLLVPAL